jgi:hypothetical protein
VSGPHGEEPRTIFIISDAFPVDDEDQDADPVNELTRQPQNRRP